LVDLSGVPTRNVLDTRPGGGEVSGAACPVCRDPKGRSALWWSKAGMTYLLCGEHQNAARSGRRLRAEFKRMRDGTFTMVKMERVR